jgi:acyl carrier protein
MTVSGAGVGAVAAPLRQILVQITGDDGLLTVPLETPLLAGGAWLDSLTGTLLLREVQRRFGVDVAAEDLNLDALATLGTLAVFIADRTGGDPAGTAGAAPR